MGRYLVLSDMHFGTPESSINDATYRRVLTGHIARCAPWDEIVFSGDLLDANLSSLQRAIEGSAKDRLFGFREFLAELDAAMPPGQTLADVAGRWVYVPGNHDYKLWDMLSAEVAFSNVLASGAPLGTIRMPLQRWAWTGHQAFLGGLFFKPGRYDVRPRMSVEYPDHAIGFDDGWLLVTHGHYLDASQTRFSDLAECLPPDLSAAAAASRVRQVFIETAQYQTVANAVSFTRDTKQAVSALVGPAGLVNKINKVLDGVRSWFGKLFFHGGGAVGEVLSDKWLRNVDAYVEHIAQSNPPREVRWFVFGHTHKQGSAQQRTPRHQVEVHNAGSCYPDEGKPITFAEIHTAGGAADVRLRGVAQGQDGWQVV